MKIRAAFLLFAIGIASAQQPAVIRTETREVLVDVVVTGKKGVYVNDLTQKDFHVFEDKKEQPIRSVIHGSGGDASSTPDYLVVMLDYSGLSASEQVFARQMADRFIDRTAAPNRLLAVAVFDNRLRIQQSFTNNAGRLKSAVDNGRVNTVAESGIGAGEEFGAKYRFQAVRELARNLAGLPGRKSVVFFTGNLPLTGDQKDALAAAVEACNRASVAIYPADVRDISGQTTPAAETGASSITSDRIVNRGGGSTAGLKGDPGDYGPPSSPNPFGGSEQGMFPLANGTGGFVIRNVSELQQGLEKIAQEQDEYYLIAYPATDSKADSCHSIKVKIDRGGTNVRARSSYCTAKTQNANNAAVSQSDLEKRAASVQPGTTGASVELPFFYVSPGVARVNLAMEIPAAAIQFEKRNMGLHADVNFVGIAATSDGATAARFTDAMPIDIADATAQTPKSVHYEKQFKIAPGQYTFTLLFGSGEKLGKIEQPLIIEPWQTGQLAVSGLVLTGEIVSASAARPAASLLDDRRPLVFNGAEMIPSGANVFRKSEKLYCYLEIYTMVAPTLDMRIVDPKAASPLWEGRSKVDLPAGKSVIPVGLNLPVASLPAGRYRLQITASDDAGKMAERTVSFEIE